jgi:23S rRNA (guanosine2251-2'-O)-methyltransferase
MSELNYGRRAVLETLRANRRRIFRLWVEGDEGQPVKDVMAEILAEAEAIRAPVRFGVGGLFKKLKDEGLNAQGVALEVGDYAYARVEECLALAKERGEPPLLLLLDQVQDPQNLGTLVRTAENLGVHGLIIPKNRAAGVTPAVSNASAGAVEHLLVAQVTNLNRTIDELKKEGVWVAGLEDTPDAQALADAPLDGAIALVVGSEGSGLSRLTREKCDFLVRLPMHGRIASYNAAVAGSIALYVARSKR